MSEAPCRQYDLDMRLVRSTIRRCRVETATATFLSLSIASGLAWVLPGCHEARPTDLNMPAEGEDLPILHQVQGAHSHEMRAMQLVIRDAATFARVPLVDVPVDFSQEMLLVVTLGRVPSDQYRVGIDRVWREGHKLRVATTVVTPAPGAPLVIASPYCIAVVPRCGLNVEGFGPEPPRRSRPWGQSALPDRR